MRWIFTKLAVAVTVGFLGAYSFAPTSGLLKEGFGNFPNNEIITISGIILFFLTLGLIGPAVQLAQKTVDSLSRAEERPGPMVALGMLILGTVSAISAMFVQYSAMRSHPGQISVNTQGFSMPQGLSMHPSGSFGLGVLTFLTFLLGASLIGLGVWASLKPAPRTTGPVIKPSVPELDEVRV